MPAIEQFVAEALVERQAELRSLVRDAVDSELHRLISALVAAEIEQRQNGSAAPVVPRAPNEAEPTSTKQCSDCSRQYPLDHFLRGRSRCRDCRRVESRARRQRRLERQRAPSDDEEPHPAAPVPPRRGTELRRGQLVGTLQQQREQERRELLGELRANGVEHEQRDGQTFTVLHLPEAELSARAGQPPVFHHASTYQPRRVA